MWIETTRWPVMDGEPHLGYMYESELMGDDAVDIIVQYIVDTGDVSEVIQTIDDYSDEMIDLDVADFIDYEAVREYVEQCEMEGTDLTYQNVLDRC